MSIASSLIKRPVLPPISTILIALARGNLYSAITPGRLLELALKQVAVTANYLGTDARTLARQIQSAATDCVHQITWHCRLKYGQQSCLPSGCGLRCTPMLIESPS